jgi:hypothetical protein
MKPSELPGTRTNGTLASLAGTDEQGRLATAGGFVVPEDYLPNRDLTGGFGRSQLGSLARKKRTLWTDSVPERPPPEKIRLTASGSD